MNFTGKVALVTGGGGGIGRATCLAFAARGAKVVVVDFDPQIGEDTVSAVHAAGGDARFVQADVTKSADVRNYVKAAMNAYGRIDCFFNNAGIEGKVVPIQEYDEDVFDAVIAVNLKGVFLGLRHVLPVMLKQGGGAVVNTASIAGMVGTAGMSAYVASKHAVMGLTKVAAAEVGKSGIRVNAICPGPIDTRMVQDLAKQVSPNNPGAVQERYGASLPLGRYGTADEVANILLFLSSDLASNITGAQYPIDGGRTAAPAGVSAPVVE